MLPFCLGGEKADFVIYKCNTDLEDQADCGGKANSFPPSALPLRSLEEVSWFQPYQVRHTCNLQIEAQIGAISITATLPYPVGFSGTRADGGNVATNTAKLIITPDGPSGRYDVYTDFPIAPPLIPLR